MSPEENTADLESMLNEAAEQTAQSKKTETAPPPVPTPQTAPRPGNEIFSEGSVKQVSKQEYAKQEFDVVIPVDAVPLPSAGKVYPEEHPFHNAEQVSYRGMTAKEEDILMSEALIKRGTVITELIKSCLIDKNVNVNSLLSGDRNAIMIAIRISGYGREYEPTFVCPQCNHKNETKYDLADLSIKPLTIEPTIPGANLFKFKLPMSGKEVEFKFLTGTEEEKVLQVSETRKKKGIPNNNLVTSRLMSSIVSVDGNSNPGYISGFVGAMLARDSLALRNYMNKHEPGVDMEVEFTCAGCEYYDKIQLPMGSSFFWPQK